MSPQSRPPLPPHLRAHPKLASDGRNPCTSSLSGRFLPKICRFLIDLNNSSVHFSSTLKYWDRWVSVEYLLCVQLKLLVSNQWFIWLAENLTRTVIFQKQKPKMTLFQLLHCCLSVSWIMLECWLNKDIKDITGKLGILSKIKTHRRHVEVKSQRV